MGITKFDADLLSEVLRENPNITSVIELGSQNLYLNGEDKPPFASEWYKQKGLLYACIDLAGDNGAIQEDLSKDISANYHKDAAMLRYDLVTDFGTSEHVVQMKSITKVGFHDGYINSIYPDGIENIDLGFYNCWLNKHNLLNEGGLMVNVNPKTGHWPGHGYNYYTEDFYKEFSKISGYEIVKLFEHAAMGNTIDGVNIVCVLRKISSVFPSFKEFQKLDYKKS